MTPSGALTTLVTFNGTNGAFPNGLMQGSDGNFYGTANEGGSYDDGTVFEMTPSGVLTTLVSFNGANGFLPVGGLIQGNDGTFYGTTIGGGGTVFKLTLTGILTTWVYFNGANGNESFAALVQGSDGNFYGTTQFGGKYGGDPGDGVVFQLITHQVATPGFSLPSGTYTGSQTVTISSPPGGPSIRYTTDGSTPSETNGLLVSSGQSISITITATTSISAIAFETGYADSPVVTANYTINVPIPTRLRIEGSNENRLTTDGHPPSLKLRKTGPHSRYD
jgi:uncharacterized repeat protein (TIGR03803 family)